MATYQQALAEINKQALSGLNLTTGAGTQTQPINAATVVAPSLQTSQPIKSAQPKLSTPVTAAPTIKKTIVEPQVKPLIQPVKDMATVVAPTQTSPVTQRPLTGLSTIGNSKPVMNPTDATVVAAKTPATTSWSDTMNKNLGIVNGGVSTPSFTPPKPDFVNPEPILAESSVTTPSPTAAVYDYRTDPTYLNWKQGYDATNAQTLADANSKWTEKYNGVVSERDAANASLNTYKPFEQKYTQAQSQLGTLQANYDDVNSKFSDLQKAQAKSLANPSTGANLNVTTPVNMQNYNDNRNAAADQWWSKYLTGRR